MLIVAIFVNILRDVNAFLKILSLILRRAVMADSPQNSGSRAYPTVVGAALPAGRAVTVVNLSARLQALIGSESVSSFARKCGLAESVLRTYLRDGRMPPLDKALAIAVAAGVSVDWLAKGRGVRIAAEVPRAYGASPAHAPISEAQLLDAAVLERILTTVLAAEGVQSSPEHLAALVVDLYQRAKDDGAAADGAAVGE